VLWKKFGMDEKSDFLHKGLSFVRAGYGYECFPEKIPTLEQLETVELVEFKEIKGFETSYFFAKFLLDNYEMKEILDLLENYNEYKKYYYNNWVEIMLQKLKQSLIKMHA